MPGSKRAPRRTSPATKGPRRKPRGQDLRALVELVAHLRSPGGCPWDRAQTHSTLTGLLIEEAYEVVEAIGAKDAQSLKDELGDLLLHVAFHVQIAQEASEFTLADVLRAVQEKVIRRHPHVFGDRPTQDMGEIKARWEELKRQEGNYQKRKKMGALPALVEARKTLDRAESLEVDPMWAVDETFDALADRVKAGDAEALGQLFFQMIALAREAGLEPEFCLKQATAHLAEQLEVHMSDQDEKPS